MHIIPNGQNIQFIVPTKILPPMQAPPEEPDGYLEFAPPSPGATSISGHMAERAEKVLKQLPKDVAPGLNRRQRKHQLAQLKANTKAQTAAAVEKEMRRQKKESKNV